MDNKQNIEELNQQLMENNRSMALRKEEMQMIVEGLEKELNAERDARETL
jgi:uncharacterized coiled-coil protein SlyX